MKLIKVLFLTLALLCVLLFAGAKFLQKEMQPYLAWSGLSSPESAKVDMSKPLHDQKRRIELAGMTFDVPLIYIDARLDPGLQQKGLLLEVIWPEMTTIYELSNKEEYEKVWRDERKLGWIMLEPQSVRLKLDEQVNGEYRCLL